MKRIAVLVVMVAAAAIAVALDRRFAAPRHDGLKSDHFDGKRFHNHQSGWQSEGSFLKWQITREPGRFASIGLRRAGAWRDTVLGLGVGTIWLGCAIAPFALLGLLSLERVGAIAWVSLAGTIVALAFNTVTQELLTRGYVLQTIQAHSNSLAAVLGSSLVFALLHFGAFRGSWLPAVNVFLAGVLFAIAYLKTQSLWLPIGTHFAWNLLLGPLLGGAVSGTRIDSGWQALQVNGPALWTGGSFGLEGGLAVTIATVVATALLLLWRRGQPARQPDIATP